MTHDLKSRTIKTKAARTKVKVHPERSPTRWGAAIDNMKYEQKFAKKIEHSINEVLCQ